jgi:hypothetical protein
MGTTADKLQKILSTKNSLKAVIADNGGAITDETPFAEYPTILSDIIGSGGSNDFVNQVIERTVTEITEEDLEGVVRIGEYAFCNCYNLTNITIPESVTTIGQNAFSSCYKLVEVYNKSSLNITAGSSSNGNIGGYALNVYSTEGGSKLSTDNTGCIIYTDSSEKMVVSYVGDEMSLTLSSNITQIRQYAFYHCDNLTSVTVSNSVTTIGSHAFASCVNLTSVTIPDSVMTIGDHAFYGCGSLINVSIGNSVTTIGSGAFWNCYRLANITIPSSVTTIENGAFSGCGSLTNMIIHCSIPPILASNTFKYCNSLIKIYVPYGCGEAYKSATNWSAYADLIEEMPQ